MKVCTYNGLEIAVLTRNEHCPPHVHVGTDKWEARFKFSYWHNGVELWDVVPLQNQPAASVLEAIRQTIKQPANLRCAREKWWSSMQTVCLKNQMWDVNAEEVVPPKSRRRNAFVIQGARFDASTYKAVLTLAGHNSPLEIEL